MYIYIYIRKWWRRAAAPTYCTWTVGGREGGKGRFSRENHARPAKSALTKMSLAAGTSRTHPFVSILCQVPIRAVSRTALYNEGTRRKGENGAHREKKGWRKRERVEGEHKVSWKLAYVRASYREHLANDREKNCYAPTKLWGKARSSGWGKKVAWKWRVRYSESIGWFISSAVTG